MSKNSKSELDEFLFHLRTPLASLRGVAILVEKVEIPGNPFPPEAREWINKWMPKVDLWLKKVTELTSMSGESKAEDHNWKDLIQDLISSFDGLEIAASEAHNIPLSEKSEPGDVVRMIVSLIDYINERYKAMRELLPTLA
jgi:hypothetical protein